MTIPTRRPRLSAAGWPKAARAGAGRAATPCDTPETVTPQPRTAQTRRYARALASVRIARSCFFLLRQEGLASVPRKPADERSLQQGRVWEAGRQGGNMNRELLTLVAVLLCLSRPTKPLPWAAEAMSESVPPRLRRGWKDTWSPSTTGH